MTNDFVACSTDWFNDRMADLVEAGWPRLGTTVAILGLCWVLTVGLAVTTIEWTKTVPRRSKHR